MATVSLDDIIKARAVIYASGHVFRTPLVQLPGERLGVSPNTKLYGKMENMQNTGSFKVRGLVNMIARAPQELRDGHVMPITMSGGNFACAFAQILSSMGLRGRVVMPDTVHEARVEKVKAYGIQVDQTHVSKLEDVIRDHMDKEDMVYLHPYDDEDLIAGHGSAGLEILEDASDIDVVVVCCGGGGLLAGVSAAIRQTQLSNPQGKQSVIFGVEPHTADTMYQSLREGRAIKKDTVRSVASGLCPPYAGEKTFRHIKEYVKEVVLVSDEEIVESMRLLYSVGLLVEPSGAASLAAVRSGLLGNLENKKVVIMLSGSNISPTEMAKLLKV